VRGTEARTLLDSFNTGHSGSLATIHANSAAKALRRFANLVMRSHQQATYEDVEAEIGEAVNFVVHVERQPGRRAIREVLRLDGYDRQAQEFRFEMVFGGAAPFIKGDLNHLETRNQSHSKDRTAEIADTASRFVQRM